MVLASLLFFLPALALSSKDSVAIVPAEDLKVCEYFDARIVRLREIVNKELGPDVDIGSDLYTTLEESKLCDTVGYVAIPECVANNGGDECVARKTSELIRKTLRAAMKAEKIKEVPSGEKFFATCKHIGYKNVLKTFKSARSLMAAECGLPGQKLGNRHARNADLLPALLLAGSYDPSSIWFQYFLCKDIDLYCYFFTQGWTQGQYGQYYLYDNLLDENTGLFAGSTDSSNLATIALLGGLGGGIGQPSGYYPSYGSHAASAQGRKRRETTICSNEDDSLPNCTSDRKRRHLPEEKEEEEERNRRETRCSDVDASLPYCTSRKRRQEPEKEVEEEERKRRETRCSDVDASLPNCTSRKRRQEPEEEEEEGERNRRETRCSDVDASLPNCTSRKRRQEPKEEEEEEERKRRETRCSDEENCTRRKRRATATCDDNDDSLPDCTRKRRSPPSEACEACKKNPDSTDCEKC